MPPRNARPLKQGPTEPATPRKRSERYMVENPTPQGPRCCSAVLTGQTQQARPGHIGGSSAGRHEGRRPGHTASKQASQR
jgi:hypothetical protein